MILYDFPEWEAMIKHPEGMPIPAKGDRVIISDHDFDGFQYRVSGFEHHLVEQLVIIHLEH